MKNWPCGMLPRSFANALDDNKVKEEKLRGTLCYSVVHLINLWCIKINQLIRLLLLRRTWSVAWLPCYR